MVTILVNCIKQKKQVSRNQWRGIFSKIYIALVWISQSLEDYFMMYQFYNSCNFKTIQESCYSLKKKKISLVLDHLIVEFVNPKNCDSTFFFRKLPLLFSVAVIRRIECLGHVLDVLYEKLPSIVLVNQPKLLWMVSQGVLVKNLEGVLQSSCHL